LIAGVARAQSDMYAPDHVWTDQYFAELAKPATAPLPAVPIAGTIDVYFGDQLHGSTLDFQNYHATGDLLDHGEISKDAGKYQDITRYATPGGLQQINQ
jgi:hypothetical protein